MHDEKRSQIDAKPATAEEIDVSLPNDDPHDLFSDEEHDGWSEIKRRPSDPGLQRVD